MYYVIVREVTKCKRPVLLLLAGYCDLAGKKTSYWHEDSVTHPETERYESLDEATTRAEKVGGKVRGFPKKVYQWLLDQKRLDEEEVDAAVSC